MVTITMELPVDNLHTATWSSDKLTILVTSHESCAVSYGTHLACIGWVIPPSLIVPESPNTPPQAGGGFGYYMPLAGRAARIRQQFL